MIIVVSILTVILALIAIGFSKLSNRELIQASHRESAAQAYYAAQSGINDAIAYINDGGSSFPGCTWPTAADTPPPPVDGNQYFTSDLSGTSNIAKYSCISVEKALPNLQHTVTPGTPWVVKIDADKLEKLYIGWENDKYPNPAHPVPLSTTASPPDFGKLPQDSAYENITGNPNTTGVLRVGIYGVLRSDASDDNSTLASNSSSYYLYPNEGGGAGGEIHYHSGDYSITSGPSGQNGEFVRGDCDNSRPDPLGNGLGLYCNSKITDLHGNDNYYYLYFTAQFAALKVVIQGKAGGPDKIFFNDAQAVIDVTGQSADQIQRVRARVDLTPQFNAPSYAVQSMESLCKAFVLDIVSPSTYQPSPPTWPTNDPSCTAPTSSGSIGHPAPGELSGH